MTGTVSFAPESRPVATELLRSLNRHRTLFTVVFLVVTALGVSVVEVLPTRYTAVATVVVTPLSPDPMQPATREDTGLRDDEVATQAALMASRDLVLEVARRHPVAAAPGLAGLLRQRACVLAGAFCGEQPPAPPESRAALFLDRLRTAQVPRTRLIDLSYGDADPEVAADALNTLVELFQQRQIAQRAADLSRTSNWISERAETLRRAWLEAEARAGRFRQNAGLAPGAGTREASTPLVTQQVSSAATSLSGAQADLSAARARHAALKAAGTSAERLSFLSMRDEPGLVQLGTQLTGLRVQLAEQRGQYSDSFPGLAPLRIQIASLERQLAAEMGRALHAVEVELQVKQALVANTEQRLALLRSEAGNLNAQQVQLSTLEDEARSARTVFETFLGRARQLDDRAGLLQPQVQVATRAEVPDLPSFPNRPRLWLASVVLGLVAALGLVLLREFLARGFSNISRVGDQLSLPFLCAIPAVSGRGPLRRLARRMQEHPFSSTAEAMRTLLTQFQLRGTPEHPVRTVVIASATGQEGKTTTAIWLAGAAARGGSRVLLIDGDHRRGAIGERLGGDPPEGGPGFSDVVFASVPVERAVRRDAAGEFDFVPAGQPVARSFSRTDVQRLRDTLDQLASRYDLVIIDTPPLLSMTDAFLYARLADGVVFLCRWSRTSRDAVSGCLARLRAAEAEILGVALSMVDERRLARFSDELTRHDVRVMKRYYVG